MIREQVALHVRVKIRDSYKSKSINYENLKKEEFLYICDPHIYNDQNGDYVRIEGASGLNLSILVHLGHLDLEFPVIKL